MKTLQSAFRSKKITYRSWGDLQPNTIVFIHGNTLNSEFFTPFIESNLNLFSNYQIIAIDLPGCGESEKFDEYSLSFFAEFLIDFITNLECENVSIVGHSLGGHIALQALSKGVKLNKLICVSTNPAEEPAAFDKMFSPHSVNSFLFEKIWDKEQIKQFSQVMNLSLDYMQNSYNRADNKIRPSLAKSIIQGDYEDEVKLLLTCSTPILFLFGKNDELVNSEYWRKIKQRNLSFTTFVEIEGANHNPFNSTSLTANCISEFIEKS